MSGRAAATVVLPTAIVGPMETGRGYTVLAHSPGVWNTAWDGMLKHFSLALGAWADRRAEPFVAMFPLDDAASAFAVARVAYVGEGELGTIAVGNVVIVPGEVMSGAVDWRGHRLLAKISPPELDDLGFADAPLTVDVAALKHASVHPTPSFGLEWRDQRLDVGDSDPQAVLGAAIDGIDPPEQRARITGWATTDALQRSGAFDPQTVFRLIVRGGGEGVTARVPVPTVAAAAPLAWQVWSRVLSASARINGAAVPMWNAQYTDRAADGVAAIAILEACLPLDPVGRARLLGAVAEAAAGEDQADAELLRGAALALGRLMDQPAAAEGAAYYLNDFVEGAEDQPKAAAAVAHLALRDGVLGWMSPLALDLLLGHGLLDRLAETPRAERAGLLQALTPQTRAEVLAATLRAPDEDARRDLLSQLLAFCLNDQTGHRTDGTLAPSAMTRLLRSPGPIGADLATPEAWRLVQAGGRDVRAAFAGRVLSPVITGEARVSPRAFLTALDLSLRAVRAEQAA